MGRKDGWVNARTENSKGILAHNLVKGLNEDDSDTTDFEVTDEAGNKQENMPNGYWEFEPAHEQITRVFTAKLTQVDGRNVSYVTLIPRVEQIGG